MVNLLRHPSFLPSSILAGVGFVFVVLAATLPPLQMIGVVGGSAVATALVIARVRRDMAESATAGRLHTRR